jgi:hypothetical protein
LENSNLCTKYHGKSTQDAQVLLSQIPPKLQNYMGEIERKTKENSQRTPRYRDPTCSPLLEMILIGGNVHIDLL